jgi:PIN domain nuclease of toxin-antitoxin system
LDSGNFRITPQILEKLRWADHRYLSAATAWELSLKQAAGKLKLSTRVSSMLSKFRLEELPVTIRHGDIASGLQMLHRDPVDRMLIAQAQAEGLTLVTADRILAHYSVPVLLV